MMRFAMLGVLLFAIVPPACGGTNGSAAQYVITVNFNTSVTGKDLQKTKDFLRAYDEDMEFAIMESFPPMLPVLLTTDASDFCATIERELGVKAYVRDVTCGEWEEPDASESPEEPVGNN